VRATARDVLAAAVPEAAFTQHVLQEAKRLGWRTAHFRPAQNARGDWRTPVAGDGKGFPDLVLLKGDRVVIAELKAVGKYPEPAQRAWLDAWRAAGVEVHVWRPTDWALIDQVLR
jgi:hypothetical protein